MDGTTEATPQSGSLAEATQRIAGLLSVKPDTEKPADTQPEPKPREAAADSKLAPAAPDTGSEQASAETEQTEDEASQPPPPKTWKIKVDGADVEVTEDELTKGYSRTADYTRKAQALADERRKWEDNEVTAARAVRDQQQKGLEEIKNALKALQPKEPNWEELRKTATPDEFSDALFGWKRHVEAVQQIEAEQKRIAEEQHADAQKGFARFVEDEQRKLSVELPEMADPVKGPALKRSLAEFAKSRGFTDDELNQVVDHRVIVLLHDAYSAHQVKAKATAEKAKIENKINDAIEPVKPGARSEPQSSKAKQLTAAKNRLRETGRVEDAASVIKNLL